MIKFIEFLKRLFISSETPSTAQGRIFTHSDLPHCAVLELSKEQQKDKLISDGYATKILVSRCTVLPKDIGKVDPKLEHLGIPLQSITQAKFQNKAEEELRFNQDFSAILFSFFEERLNQFIKVELFTQRHKMNEYLSEFEEREKRKGAYRYFRGIFNTLSYEMIRDNEPIDKLFKGIEQTNLLSRFSRFEDFFKTKIFKNNQELIIRYLYCQETLKVDNIHAYYSDLLELIQLCAHRNLMLELNEKYSFEINHPYAFKYSRGLVYANHANLFQDEIGFDWMVEKLSSVENFSLSFLSRLTYVLRDEKVLSPKTKNTEFCDFLNQNFQTDLKKLRPDEALISETGSEVVTTLINELNNFRKAKI